MVRSEQPHIVMEIVDDPEELAETEQRRQRFERNWAWYQAHALEIGEHYRGQHICIAGQKLFAANTAKEAKGLAMQAHPEDDGYYLKYVYKEKMDRVYANQRAMACV